MIYSEANSSLLSNNISSVISFMCHAQSQAGSALKLNCKDLYESICQVLMPISRSIVGDDLLNLFHMIGRYGVNDQVYQLLLSVSPNLMTIESKKVTPQAAGEGELQFTDKGFEEINQREEFVDTENKVNILKLYEGMYHQKPEMLRRPEASLSPLSYLMAQVFDKYKDEDVLTWLQMLGSEKVENYHETFIKKLYERYTMPQVIDNMATYNQKFFLKFAKHWPHFLKNNDLLN